MRTVLLSICYSDSGQFHLGTEGTGSHHAQDLPMVQGAIAEALVGAGVIAWTTLSSGTL